ncbi:DUF6768 family protein [Amphiplicatus metriothermophilus]|uniref:Uncharacterized protein n=1 Tax=Amphiplicatus metriothermophilus TaxID=1519374 RepID=A0A239PJ31_9PROT|nr:DUF6768 family protein [Amphiplicatus metriothermophilus]MBB5517865.1 hypothetical protein [Amphiplicatus metriothermophilus]SNT67801.1 hypothetical protein SAMN06297382_0294 [Amphiplicatus metriothermophilus]
MTDIDRMIEEALEEEDRALLEKFSEQNLLAQGLSVYRGRQAWVAALATVIIFAMFGAAVYSAIQFIRAQDALAALRWGGATLLFMIMVAFMKVWFWLRMEANRILREIKRVELQLARMQGKQAA